MHNDKIGHGAHTQAAHRGFEDGMALPKFTLADIRRSSCPKHFKDESCGDCPILYECSRCYAVPNPCLRMSMLEKARTSGAGLASELLQGFLRLSPSERLALLESLKGESRPSSTPTHSRTRTS